MLVVCLSDASFSTLYGGGRTGIRTGFVVS